MSLTLPYPTIGPGPVDNEVLQENFTAIANKFGNIDNSDMKTAGGVSIDKLSASYEYMNVVLSGATTGAVGTLVDFVPMYNDSKGDWTVVGVQYLLQDVGSTKPAIRVRHGYFTNNTTTALGWNALDEVTAATTLGGASADDNNHSATIATTDTSIQQNANFPGFGLFITTQGVASGTVWVSVLLKRQIAT
jgi:hypothetical protein